MQLRKDLKGLNYTKGADQLILHSCSGKSEGKTKQNSKTPTSALSQ